MCTRVSVQVTRLQSEDDGGGHRERERESLVVARVKARAREVEAFVSCAFGDFRRHPGVVVRCMGQEVREGTLISPVSSDSRGSPSPPRRTARESPLLPRSYS